MRPSLDSLISIALAAATLPALAALDPDIQVIRFVRVLTQGPVVLTTSALPGGVIDSFRDIGELRQSRFVHERGGKWPNRCGCSSCSSTRAGIARRARCSRATEPSRPACERPAAEQGGRVNREDCVPLHTPRGGVSAIVAYIERVDFLQRRLHVVGEQRAHRQSRRARGAQQRLRLYQPADSNPSLVNGAALTAGVAALNSGELPPPVAGGNSGRLRPGGPGSGQCLRHHATGTSGAGQSFHHRRGGRVRAVGKSRPRRCGGTARESAARRDS